MTQPQRILHVEDDPSIRLVTSLTLEKIGKFTVLSCDSGAQALQEAPGFDPDVVLLDVMMPGMDGPATLQALRQGMAMEGRLVLFMTAKVQQQELDHYHAIGAWGVIEKPFDPMQLADQIRQHWNRYCATGQHERCRTTQ